MAWGNKVDKMFVKVEGKLDDNEWNIPVELTYNDEKFEIIDPVRSMKLFNNAIRYKCNIDGRLIELFNEGEEWWIFV
ncbi:hypothetical protein Amet_3463 [Alkaliphilus metalliredigens QYMF]|uniref:Uncharacterized protein n=1 Tax=Alkaliphilus metalliredigens (strain QYMF) TaxID=293826 RepID=A6TTS3_ALKMQ|nr:hypothetical protein [Alkaliphilus metalliredigens]ABR49591.1 hypothetical protein Amet_3463 [Alkaliphilus metalliredigens QYMF]